MPPNEVWATDCLLVLFASGATPTLLEQAFVWVQIVTVLVFAELECIGLRREPLQQTTSVRYR